MFSCVVIFGDGLRQCKCPSGFRVLVMNLAVHISLYIMMNNFQVQEWRYNGFGGTLEADIDGHLTSREDLALVLFIQIGEEGPWVG